MNRPLNKDQQKFLLELSRKTIEYFLKKGKTLKIKTKDAALKQRRGAFVTLKVNGHLRGCIGNPLPMKALYETIIDMAISACSRDYRFPPLTLEELPDTKIEVSVLSLPQLIDDPSKIKVGTHGIIVSKGSDRGLLLPQVPVEWNWDLETYLGHGCLKAGLAEDAWKKGAQIEVFSAEVFSE
ncbi:AmmeMemoRadiSam system protein A [Acidobacteriota bacterium]